MVPSLIESAKKGKLIVLAEIKFEKYLQSKIHSSEQIERS